MSDVSKTSELIAEAREHTEQPGSPNINDGQGYCGRCSRNWPCVTSQLADALEAATRVPVQGEPNDDRETLATLLDDIHDPLVTEGGCNFHGWVPGYMTGSTVSEDVDAILAAGFSRATVPDAATETPSREWLEDVAETHAFCADRLTIEVEKVERALAERDAALAAVERVRELHTPDAIGECQECEGSRWPCATRAALDGAPEPEMEYRWIKESPHPLGMTQVAHVYHRHEYDEYVERHGGRVERRRKAGPWLPVEGGSKP